MGIGAELEVCIKLFENYRVLENGSSNGLVALNAVYNTGCW